MRPFISLMPLVALCAGCATEGFVNRQVDPLAERVGKLEAKMSTLEIKQAARDSGANGANGQGKELSPADQASLKEVRDLARMAFEKACKAEADVQRAEQAVKDAETSARKSQKMFELHQKK